jgi:hypothetical protein
MAISTREDRRDMDAVEVRSTGPVATAFAELNQVTKEVIEVTAALETRLEGVMTPKQAVPESSQVPLQELQDVAPMSKITAEIYEQAAKLKAYERRLSDILSRLEV